MPKGWSTTLQLTLGCFMPYNKFSITTKKKKKNISKDMPSRKRKNPLESFNFVLRACCPIPAKIGRIEVGMGHAKPSGVLPPFFDKDGRYLLIGHCPHGQPNNEALTNLVKWLHCHSYIRKLHYWMCFKTSYSRFSNALKKRFPVTCVWIWWGVLLMNFLVSSQ